MDDHTHHTIPLTRYAWLSIAAALITILLKTTAYFLTGSVGLLSDALESTVNLASAIVALIALRIVTRPANDEFTFGFYKVEYFASGFEGGMILLAAVARMTGLMATYPVDLVNNLSGIFYYDIGNSNSYAYLDWRRTYDNWTFDLILFANPEQSGFVAGLQQSLSLAGKGIVLLVVFNH